MKRCFAIGLWRVRLGADMFQAESLAEPAESKGLIAGSVVGHDALDLDAQALVVSERRNNP
jgi:hypothetical protein